MTKLYDRSTVWCEPSDCANSDRCRKKRRVGEDRIRIRDTLWARPGLASLSCPAAFLSRLSQPPPTVYTWRRQFNATERCVILGFASGVACPLGGGIMHHA